MSRSTAALLIAIMFHILLLLLFNFLMNQKPNNPPKKPQEHRIKVALKDPVKHKNKKSAALKNKIKPVEKAPPMPKGKQLKELAPKPQVKKKPVKNPKSEPKKIKEVQKKIENLKKEIKKVKKQSKPKKTETKKTPPKPVSKKKAPFKHTNQFAKKETKIKKVEDLNVTKKPEEKKSGLYAMLSKKQKTKDVKREKQQRGTQIGSDFKEAYGEAFGKLSEGEKQYIIDNQEIMRRITQEQLNRLAPVNIPRNLHTNTSNIIEFYLHPNGDISGLKLINNSSHQILDDTSLQTIEYSYHRYPLPKQKTLVRYKVGYWLGTRRH